MWTKADIKTDWTGGPVKPLEVLFDFDGPSIFTTRIGLSTFLLLKQDEEDGKELFLAVTISDDEIDKLKSGRMSIRGAASYRDGWLIESEWDYKVKRFQKISYGDFERYLPQSGIGLLSKYGVTPDSVEQAQSFLSFKYDSPEMSRNSIPLSMLKSLVDKTSSIVRQSLLPPVLQAGRKQKFIDFDVSSLKFSSLLIAVKEPRFDTSGFRNIKSLSNINFDNLESDAIERGGVFLTDLTNAASIAQNKPISKSEAEDNFEIIDRMAEVVPSKHNDLTTLQVGLNLHNKNQLVTITREIGDRISDARRSIPTPMKTINGVVVEVNDPSKTFILRENGGPHITVNPTFDIYKNMAETGLNTIGTKLILTGKYWERTYRDYMLLTKHPVPKKD